MSTQRIQLRDGSSIDMPDWYYKQARERLKHHGAWITLHGATAETKKQPIIRFLTTEIVSIREVDTETRDVTVNEAGVTVNVAAPNVYVEPPQVTLQMPDNPAALTVDRDPTTGLIQQIRPV